MACLQDLSQARDRWGEAAADGFLSLFQTKLILTGIADTRTLEAISLALGEYDRQLVSYTLGRSHTEPLPPPPRTAPESVTYHTQRHRTLPPGEIARPPKGMGCCSAAPIGGCCASRRGIARSPGWRSQRRRHSMLRALRRSKGAYRANTNGVWAEMLLVVCCATD